MDMVTVTVLPLEAAGCGSIMLLLPLFILFCKCWAVYSIASVQEQKTKCRRRNYWTVLKILVTCLATIAYVYCSYAVYVTILVLPGNFNQFWVLHSYTLLLKSPILMHSWKIKTILKCYCLMGPTFLHECEREGGSVDLDRVQHSSSGLEGI